MAAIDKFRKMFDKSTTKAGDQWLEKLPAWLGRKDGTVATDTYGLIYVRTADGQVLQVFNNNKVDLKYNLLVRIGRHKDEPNIWQIVGRREAWDIPAASGVMYHHQQHEFNGPDMLMLDRRQIVQLSVLVSDAANFLVTVYGAFIHTPAGVVQINTQGVDLSGDIPTAGAVFANIEGDDAGALSVHVGTAFGSPLVATVADIPTPAAGKYIVATILLHEGQTELSNNDIRVPMPIGAVSRIPTGGTTGQILAKQSNDDFDTIWQDAMPTRFDDLRIEPTARSAGVNVPSFEKWLDDSAGTSRGVYLYSFDDVVAGSEKELFFTMQLPHAWKEGSAITLHVHWIGAVNDTDADPRWGLEYAWKDIGQTFADTVIVYTNGTHIDGSGSPDVNVTALKHYISPFAAITPDSTQNNLSSIIIGRLFRDSANAGDTYNATGAKCGLLYIDAHIEIDSMGSTSEYVK